MTVEGIDVSKWQDSLPSLTGLDFLFARASIGLSTDGMYARHIAAAKRSGLVTGAYHFGYNFTSMVDQADLFMRAAGDVDFLWVDVEGKYAPSKTETATFIRRCHAKGKRCGLYHSLSGYFDAGQDYDWVAKWSATPPGRKWNFWQYTSSGHLSGYSGRLDLDRFNGTRAQLRALAGIPPDSSGTTPDAGAPAMTLNIENNELLRIKVPRGEDIFDLNGVKVGTLSSAVERTVYHRVNLAGDTRHFYVGQFPGGGPGPDLLMVKAGPAIELGAPVTDAEALQSRIAQLELAAEADTLLIDALELEAADAANAERERIAQSEYDRIEAS